MGVKQLSYTNSGTPCRPPEVSSTTFAAHLPNLQLRTLMDMDFVTLGQLVQPVLPHIRFLPVRSQLCYTLPYNPASQQRSCAPLTLHLQVSKHARHT